MILLKRAKVDVIIIFGGYSNELSAENTEFEDSLNDIWVYSINSLTWKECFPNSDYNPEKRFGATMTLVSETKLLMFGGINSDRTLNDLWQFNIETNMWTEIKSSSLVVNDILWPNPSAYATMTRYKGGVILYGGSNMLNLLSYMEKIVNSQSNELITSTTKRKNYNSELWFLLFESCDAKNCANGYCDYGRCVCNNGYWGDRCDKRYCPNSFCYNDFDILSTQVCYHCSGHGSCNNRKCTCEEGWFGEECSISGCKNNCSNKYSANNTPLVIVGQCVQTFPISQCLCDKMQKKGGDYCQITYCLNNCSGKGVCNTEKGECLCQDNYGGEDCSIFYMSFRIENLA